MSVISRWSLVFAFLGVFSGCRFGNYEDRAPQSTTGTDGISGYYETLPQKLTFCAGTTQGSKCAETTANSVPMDVAGVLTNPTALIMLDEHSGEGVFVNPKDSRYQLPTQLYADGSLFLQGSASGEVVWDDPSCVKKYSLVEEGSYTRSGPFTSGSTLPLAGRIQLQVTVIWNFSDGCAQSVLKTMAACYQNVSLCGSTTSAGNTARRKETQDIFSRYVQLGLLTPSDIAQVTHLLYEVFYQ